MSQFLKFALVFGYQPHTTLFFFIFFLINFCIIHEHDRFPKLTVKKLTILFEFRKSLFFVYHSEISSCLYSSKLDHFEQGNVIRCRKDLVGFLVQYSNFVVLFFKKDILNHICRQEEMMIDVCTCLEFGSTLQTSTRTC